MRAVWCDPLNGAWPAWDKFRKYGITRIYVDGRETKDGKPRLRELVDGIHSQGFEAGIYRDPVWGGWSTVQEYALLASRDIRSAELDPVTQKVTPKQIAYMHDLETHDVQWILGSLRQWRVYRPAQTTDVTWEPMQGGLWGESNGTASVATTELLALLEAGGPGGIYHQNYGGAMEPFNAERVRANLVAYHFPDARLWGFYDGKFLPAAWDGCVFTADRMAA